MSATAPMTSHREGPPAGLLRWLSTTNHKDIGTLYLFFALLMFFVGGTMAMVIRAELFAPGIQLVDPLFYNQMVTLHALVMIFGAVMPAWVGLANWQLPLMIGAPDMALPRMNNWSFWILPFAFALLLSTLLLEGGGPATGWTLYPPLALMQGEALPYLVFAIHLMGISSVMGAINIVVTIVNLRAPGMTWMRLPMFVWTWLVTAFLLIAAMPVLAGAVTMLLTDRYFGTSFFAAAGGGDPLMFQHLFWFFGHPEVYIMILPAFGAVSTVLPTFARKPLFGYRSMLYATLAIALLSFLVWAHHMFTVGLPLAAKLFFMYTTMLIAVPTGVKVFNWVATLWRGSISFETPMLWALAFVVLFTLGGLSGLMLALVPADYQYQDSYFVVAHFHYVLVTGSVFAVFASVYYWLPKWTGHRYDERLGRLHFWLSAVSVNVLFFPQHFLGLAGMPRRVVDYATIYADWNLISSLGGFAFGLSQLIFVYVVLRTIRAGECAGDRVWEGASGLEWTIPSPAPYHSFERPPRLSGAQLEAGVAP
jgi:cytochrome c oxidase subunit 1